MPFGEKAAMRDPSGNTVAKLLNPPSDADASQVSNQIRFTSRGKILPQSLQQAKKDRFNVKPRTESGSF